MSLCVGPAQFSAVAKKSLWACLLLCIALVGAMRAAAQTSVDGAIGGFVVDAGGAALVGATVQVQNVADGTMVRATTVGKGEFLVGHLSAGEYRVMVERELFAPLMLQRVVVEVGAAATTAAGSSNRLRRNDSWVPVISPWDSG